MHGSAERDDAPIRLAILLPERLEARVRSSRCCDEVVQLGAAANEEVSSCDAIVLDPMLADADRRGSIVSLVTGAGLPCLFYTGKSAEALRAAVGMQPLRPARVFVEGVDDDERELRAAVAEIAASGGVAMLARELASRVRLLPPTLQFAVDLLLRRPEQFFDAADVARQAGMSRRHLDRVLEHHGCAPAKRWVVAARVWHAVQLQRRGHLSFTEVAARLGYADAKALRRHRASVLGEGAGSAPASVVLDRVVKYLGRHFQGVRVVESGFETTLTL